IVTAHSPREKRIIYKNINSGFFIDTNYDTHFFHTWHLALRAIYEHIHNMEHSLLKIGYDIIIAKDSGKTLSFEKHFTNDTTGNMILHGDQELFIVPISIVLILNNGEVILGLIWNMKQESLFITLHLES
ncbi:hypothetical protein ACJX0J_039120, partial [Zea mays]